MCLTCVQRWWCILICFHSSFADVLLVTFNWVMHRHWFQLIAATIWFPSICIDVSFTFMRWLFFFIYDPCYDFPRYFNAFSCFVVELSQFPVLVTIFHTFPLDGWMSLLLEALEPGCLTICRGLWHCVATCGALIQSEWVSLSGKCFNAFASNEQQ